MVLLATITPARGPALEEINATVRQMEHWGSGVGEAGFIILPEAGAGMQSPKNLPTLGRIFKQYPEIVAAYLFGSYLDTPDQARDVDLAILLREPAGSITPVYISLYPKLEEIFSPLEIDLLFLNSATIPMAFEVISTGRVIYCPDAERRTDFEYVISGLYMDYDYHLQQGRRELYEAIKEAPAFV